VAAGLVGRYFSRPSPERTHGTPQTIVEWFEAELQAMPRYISSIRNWQLSRVAGSPGARPWTHVWE
jgi:hypothetical protein